MANYFLERCAVKGWHTCFSVEGPVLPWTTCILSTSAPMEFTRPVLCFQKKCSYPGCGAPLSALATSILWGICNPLFVIVKKDQWAVHRLGFLFCCWLILPHHTGVFGKHSPTIPPLEMLFCGLGLVFLKQTCSKKCSNIAHAVC